MMVVHLLPATWPVQMRAVLEAIVMTRAAKLAAAVAAAFMLAVSSMASAMVLERAVAPGAAIVPVVSSDAHKGIGGRYGGLKGLKTGPSFGAAKPLGTAQKQPYPYRYYNDTSRGNYGCHRYGKRAIDTNNENWWLRYRACTEVGKD
jgi:hypothetical protein